MKALRDGHKRFANRFLLSGPLRPAVRMAWSLAIFAETRFANIFGGGPSSAAHSGVTAVIKTFERPQRCAALIASIRRFHPALRIIVVDDSQKPANYPGVEVVRLPFDSGVGAGRKAGLERVKTPFVLNLDDDFLFYRQTLLTEAVEILREEEQLDLVGGQVVDLPLLITHDFRSARIHSHGQYPKVPLGTRIGPVEVMDKVSNFFLARTEAVRSVGWDADLKRLDHADFFTRAKGKLVSGYWEPFKVLHVRDPFNSAYLAYRHDYARDQAVLAERYDPS